MGPSDQRLFKGICIGAAFVIVVLILLVVLG